jgi:hypothetical protein
MYVQRGFVCVVLAAVRFSSSCSVTPYYTHHPS